MIPIFIILFLMSFMSGGLTIHFIDRKQIVSLNHEIYTANEAAKEQLLIASNRVTNAEKNAQDLNNELETARNQSIQTINNYHDQLANISMFNTAATNKTGQCALSANTNTSKSKDSTSTANVSEAFDRFLKSELYEADKVAEYANECFIFIHDNYGIVKN